MQLWPLTEEEGVRIVQDLLQRMGRASGLSARLPNKVLALIRLLGGNPRLIALAVVALSGQRELLDEEFAAGTSLWLPSSC